MVSPPEEKAPELAEIAVNAPLGKLFHYRVPEPLRGQLRRGHRVLIPFGPRTTSGVCVGFPDETSVSRLKPIQGILHPDCQFDEHLLQFTRWIATYYHASWGEVLEAALPPAIRKIKKKRSIAFVRSQLESAALLEEAGSRRGKAPSQAKLLEHLASRPGPHRLVDLCAELAIGREVARRLATLGLLETYRDEDTAREVDEGATPGYLPPLEAGDAELAPDLELHPDQERAVEELDRALDGEFGSPPPPILLHGVTGSGKTEVYLRALRRVIEAGGRGLVLVPEISLTPQTVRRFRENLPDVPIAVLHSMLGPAERAAQWRDIQAGRVGLVIGARSAIFSPIPALGLIVVDEEHEPSYKQESSPRYHGRDMAILRARLLGIPVVLGSATPSVESYHHARSGKYRLVEMPRRATPHDLPRIWVIELDKSFYRPDGGGLITPQLDYQIRACLERGDQAILFLNRRGFSTYLHCLNCGHVFKCQDCDISLTYHRGAAHLACHYCNARYALPEECPECNHRGLRRSGVGTEKVVDLVERRYPGARVGRLDRDTVKTHQTLRTVIETFGRGDLDLLVGTQMLAKGHDFPGVSLVGIISADTGLHFPDFRSAERTFQLLTQVAGRAGRGERRGRVILQTFFPDHPALRLAVENDYAGLYALERENREPLGYPPFGRLAKVLVQHEKKEKAESRAAEVASRLRSLAAGSADVLGPAPAPIAGIQDRHRFQILVKCPEAGRLLRLLDGGAIDGNRRLSAEAIIDVDPQTML